MRTQTLLLTIALGLPLALLVVLALRSWNLEGAQLELEQRQTVRGVALGIVARLQRFGNGERWPGEFDAAIESRLRRPAERSVSDRLALLGDHLERMLADGHAQHAADWLDERIADANNEDLAVAAWGRLRAAALAQRSGDLERATELREQVAELRERVAVLREQVAASPERPSTDEPERDLPRDERGVRFDLAARVLLAQVAPSTDPLADLALDLAADVRTAEDRGTWALCQQVLATHASLAGAEAHRELVDRIDRERRRAAWASLVPALQRRAVANPTLERMPGPLATEWLVALAPAANGTALAARGIPVSAARADLLEGATAQLAAELGLVLELRSTDGEVWARSGPAPRDTVEARAADAILREELPSGLGIVTAALGPEAAARRAERRTVWLAILLVSACTAALAAWLGIRALRRQHQLTEEKAAFVAAVSHELRTPLTATRLLGEILERGGVDEARSREFGGRIARESERLDHLVRGVLDLARIEKVGLDPERTARVPPQSLVNEVARRHLESPARRTAPPLRTMADSAPGSGVQIRIDREAVLAALTNLVDNAVRHAADSESIELAVVEAGDRVRFEVRDRGPGVAAGDRDAIFEPFRRGGASEDTRRTRGTGIGLALVARIARAHGGRCWCEPRRGGGSVFCFELPLAPAETPA